MPRYILIILILIALIIELSFAFYLKLLYFPVNFVLVFTLAQTLFLKKSTSLWITLFTSILYTFVSDLPFGIIMVTLASTATLFIFLTNSLFNPESLPFLTLATLISSVVFSLLVLLILVAGNRLNFFSYALDFKNFLLFTTLLSSVANAIIILPVSLFFKKQTFNVRDQFPR